MMNRRMIIATGLCALASPALALPFRDWTEQTFPRRKANRFDQQGDGVAVSSDAGVSLLIRAVPEPQWLTRSARWSWSVNQGVPATDLSRKGGDDRNLALYFVFLSAEDADRLRGAAVRRILTSRAARVLVYVWGGNDARGAMMQSPHLGARGVTITLRPAGTGSYSESVDLAADYRRAFGAAPQVLFGLGLSADSDDTETSVRARVDGLKLVL
ncbi:MAG: DUF3047 domain-containing protein [Gemmobacter sp.]|nr:DUF3047 domain-containing protein [Gemmobacter sp.]